jgi:hypothetical protein
LDTSWPKSIDRQTVCAAGNKAIDVTGGSSA